MTQQPSENSSTAPHVPTTSSVLSTASESSATAPSLPSTAIANGEWQPQCRRVLPLYFLSYGIGYLLLGAIFCIPLFFFLESAIQASFTQTAAIALCLIIVAVCVGFWLAWRRYRYTFWRYDGHEFRLRTGRAWQSETCVPGSRVQHLDIKHGPLERHRRLSTLIIHTAGMRHSEIAVNGLDHDVAERLRDALAVQTNSQHLYD